ncbi:MAG TPA: hypothetical protein VF411_14910, partial [Bacteroidia bacterium]
FQNSIEYFQSSREYLQTSIEYFQSGIEDLQSNREYLQTSKEYLQTSREYFQTSLNAIAPRLNRIEGFLYIYREMKKVFVLIILLIGINFYAQDSTQQKHPLFKISGVTMVGGGGGGIGNFNQTYTSKASLQSIWPDFASKPFYNYTPSNIDVSFSSPMFGAYLNFDTYSKKKKRYAIHFQTNVGITVVGLNSYYGQYIDSGKVTYFQPLYTVSGSTLQPAYYKVGRSFNNANVNYHSTNVGLDVQQVFTTNQKRIISVFVGMGATANFSTVSKISYGQSQYKDTVLSLATPPNYNYQYTNPYYHVGSYANSYTFVGDGSAKVKGSALYQLYIPFGFNIRLGKKDKKIISHFYLTTQVRIGISILKIQSINAFYYTSYYATFGVKYRF